MADGQEVELKLELDPADTDALRGHPLLADAAPHTRAQSSTYFDTSKKALRKAGYTLRIRDTEGRYVQTVKRAGSAAGLFDRPEWEANVAGAHPDAAALAETPLADLLDPARVARLVPVIESRVYRTSWLLDHKDSEVELVLDSGTISGGGQEQALSEVEIELKSGKPEAVLDLARRLAEHIPFRIGVLSKAERGFALADGSLDKVSKAGDLDLSEDMDVGDGFVAIVHACLRHFRLNERLVASRRDAEALHQARVAMRRLRSAFSLFAPAIRDKRLADLRHELRWFTGLLGEARNLDVFIGRCPDGTPAAAVEALRRAREEAYDLVAAALDSQRFRGLMLDLVAWTEAGAWRAGRRAREPLADFAETRLDRLWRRVSDGGRDLGGREEEERHELRIEIKKLRYAVEFLAGLYRPATLARKRFAGHLEEMQESLGHLNDIATAREIVARLGLAADIILAAPGEPDEGGKHIVDAERQFSRLATIGPFWR